MRRGATLLETLAATAALLLAATPLAAQPSREPPYDLLFVGARVLDGTGNPWFRADVAVRDGRIAAVGRLEGARAVRSIDAAGKTLAPGFIDLHSHADGLDGHRNGLRSADRQRRSAPNLVSQGVTTVVVNQDGGSPPSIARQREELERLGFGPNVILMVGHNTVRRQVLALDFQRAATAREIADMVALVRQGLAAGAAGLTAGLEYVPGRWSETEELVALVSALRDAGGVYIVHERASGADPMWYLPSRDPPGPPTMLDNIRELVTVAERTGVPAVATHVKIRGADYWGSGGAIVQLVARARVRGVEVWLDQYPYDTTGSDGTTVLIPAWALDVDRWGVSASLDELSSGDGPSDSTPDYPTFLRRVLADPQARADLERDVERELERRGGPERIVVFEYPDRDWVGKSLGELAAELATTPLELAIRMQLEGFADRPGGARLRGFSLSEIDIELLAAQPFTATASDAGIALPTDGPVHARFYGTFPRKIRRYALERQALSVASAVRSATSLPARILGLEDRGLIREGMRADLVLLDLDELRDTATFFDPHRYAQGVDFVLVGGTPVVDEGTLTGALPGRILVPTARRPRGERAAP